MYQSKASRLTNLYNLLGLPVELKRLIYSFCYYPPHNTNGVAYEDELLSVDRARDVDSLSIYWPAELYTPCQHPRSHLSLYFTCRQLRSELFPVFAEHHVMNLSSVFLSQPEIAATSLVYRLQDVYHISLRFPPNGNVCACSTYGKGSQQHFCIDLRTNVERDILHFITVIQTCKDSLRLESVELALPLPCNSTSDAFSQYRALFRSVVYMAEALSRKSHETMKDTQRLLMQVKWPSNSRLPLKVRIDYVPRTSWEQIRDGTLILDRDCSKCKSMEFPVESHTHNENWLDIDDTLSAIHGDRARFLVYPGVRELKYWKIVFQPGGGFKYFSHAMLELERRRQTFI